jgi:hypothetical protein
VAARDDDVEVAEVELLDGGRKERQQAAVVLADARQPLEGAGVDRVLLELVAQAPLDMDEAEDRASGKERGDGLEDLLAPSHPGQPVVH